MLLQIGADVRQADGGKVGELTRLVFDPDSRVVASLVVQPNRGDLNELVVPGEVVQDADDQAAQLSVDQHTFDAFPPFEVDRNIAPPPDVADVTSDLIKDPIDVPDVAPVGFATGVESIAFVPI